MNELHTLRFVKMLAICVIFLLFVTASALRADEAKKTAVPVAEIGIASWNIERFDAVGPDDETFPRRSQRHLEMIAGTILETGTDVIGLQEIVPPRSASARSSLDQLIAELNKQEKVKKGTPGPLPIWTGQGGKEHVGDIYTAIVWNTRTLELLGKVTELTQLRRGYGSQSKAGSKEELRFPRIPLVARFRVRAAPENDFMVIVLHLKASSTGLYGGLDSNDIRRRGELEALLGDWLLKPHVQGELRDEDVIVLGDFNERNSVLVELLDKYGTRDDTRGRLILDASDFCDPRARFLFTSAASDSSMNYTFRHNSEKGERGREDDRMSYYRNFLDHILISRSLLDYWDGNYWISYFEGYYPLKDHVHLSDHRPVNIFLRFPIKVTDPFLHAPRR
jgi:endonuclease/exonuclease/phosphatase family metal-dependent hydrolase